MPLKKTNSAKKIGPKKSELALRRRYTRVVRLAGQWFTYLQIDHQGFLVVESRSKKRAQWFAKMLGIALARMVEKETTKP